MMGQKVNSNTLRIGKTLQWHSNWYNKLNYSFFLICDFKIREAIHDIFLCLKKLYFKISIVHILNKIVVHFHLVLFEKIKTFYLVKKKTTSKLKKIILFSFFKRVFTKKIKIFFLIKKREKVWHAPTYYSHAYNNYYSFLFFFKKIKKNNNYCMHVHNMLVHAKPFLFFFIKKKKNKYIKINITKKNRRYFIKKTLLFFVPTKKHTQKIEKVPYINKIAFFKKHFVQYIQSIQKVLNVYLHVNMLLFIQLLLHKKFVYNVDYYLLLLKYELEKHLPYFEVMREFKKKLKFLFRKKKLFHYFKRNKIYKKKIYYFSTLKKKKRKKFKYNNDIYNLIGYKLTISGRTNKRNMMTTIERYSIGNMPVQYMKKHIEYSFNTAETRLGTLGLKLWFFFKKKKRITKKNVKQYVFSKNIMYVKKKLNSVFNVHNVFTKNSTKRKSKQKKKNTRYPTTLYVNKTRNTILPAWKAKK